MRTFVALAMIALARCTPTSKPGTAPTNAPGPTAAPGTAAPTESPATAAPEPAASAEPAADKVELTRGQRLETHGVRVMLRGTGTEHRKEASTLVKAELEVRKGDEERTVSLEREQPGDAKFVAVFDLEMALESVDATRKPSTAQILVRP